MTVHVIGNCTVDVFFRLDRFPEPGETLIAAERYVDLGGKGANQALVVHRFGVPVRLIAPVGDDADGAWARNRLVAEGLDGSSLMTVGYPTDQSIITVVPTGENTIVSSASAAESLTPEAARRCLKDVRPGDLVIAQGNLTRETTEVVLGGGRAAGATTMLNPAPVRWSAECLWPLVDIAVLNRVEARVLLGTDDAEVAVTALIQRGVRMAIVTLGADGVVALADRRVRRFPAVPVKAVDTAGAGDTFCGALAASLALGLDLDTGLAIAVRAAALTVGRPGTQSAFPTGAEALSLVDAERRRGVG